MEKRELHFADDQWSRLEEQAQAKTRKKRERESRAASARPSILFSQYVREHGVAAFRNSHVLGRALHETLLARIDKLGLIEITVVIGTGSLQVVTYGAALS